MNGENFSTLFLSCFSYFPSPDSFFSQALDRTDHAEFTVRIYRLPTYAYFRLLLTAHLCLLSTPACFLLMFTFHLCLLSTRAYFPLMLTFRSCLLSAHACFPLLLAFYSCLLSTRAYFPFTRTSAHAHLPTYLLQTTILCSLSTRLSFVFSASPPISYKKEGKAHAFPSFYHSIRPY